MANQTKGLPLTEKQMAVLDFIRDTIAERGVSPSHSEIAKRFRMKWLKDVRQVLWTLELKGYVTTTLGKARSVRLTETPKRNYK